MALKHRLADASYWVYGRARHKSAIGAAGQPGTAPDFAGLRGHKYALLVTFRRDGKRRADAGVVRPARRPPLRHAHRGAHGQGAPHPPRLAGACVIPATRAANRWPRRRGHCPDLEAGDQCERAEAALDRHYGRTRRIYEKLMADEGGMVYLELVPAAPQPPSPSG